MSQAENHKLNEFLQNFPRQDIIDTLNTIDQKISSLHTISSKDFLFFNKLLKEYYKKIREIADTNNIIGDFFNKELSKTTESLKEKNQNQKNIIDEIGQNSTHISEILAQTYSSLDLIIVPFNNYKQNLITLKYLLANLKLHFTYINLPNKNDLQTSVNLLDQSIDNIQSKFEDVGSGTDTLNTQLLNLKDNLCISKTKGKKEVVEQLKKVANEIRKLSFEEYWPDNFINDLNKRTQNCFANMGEIITNIQYHDIIRQKMEHIQSSQKELIKGLNDLKNTEFPEKHLENQINFIAKIPEITDIQVAQLLYTNKDYQTSIEKIISKLIEVGHEMKELSSIYEQIISNSSQFESNFITEVKNTQMLYTEFLNLASSDWKNSLQQLTNLTDFYNSLKKDFNEIFVSEKALRGEIKIFEKLLKANGKNFGIELMRRLILLLSELQMNSNSLKTNLNNNTKQFGNLHDLLNSFNPEQKNKISIDDYLNNLTNGLAKIYGLSESHSKLSITISSEITSSFKSIEYYTYFKNTVEQIVTFLNEINKKVNYDNLKSFIGDNKEILQKIEKLYTMKSERDIHQQMVKAGEISGINEEQSQDDLDDDIELF
jgi:methyl-accepting chemotaxis protein